MLANIQSTGSVWGDGISARYFNFAFIYGNPQTSVCGFPSILANIDLSVALGQERACFKTARLKGGRDKSVSILSSHTDSKAFAPGNGNRLKPRTNSRKHSQDRANLTQTERRSPRK